MIVTGVVLYAKQKKLDPDKEIGLASLLRNDINKRNSVFMWEAMKAWDEGNEGDFGEFIKSYIGMKWYLLSLGN